MHGFQNYWLTVPSSNWLYAESPASSTSSNSYSKTEVVPTLDAVTGLIDTAYQLNKENRTTECQAYLQKVYAQISQMNFDEINQKDAKNNTLLHRVIDKDSEQYREYPLRPPNPATLSLVKALLEQGVEVDAPNNKGRTALHLACSSHSEAASELVQLLLTKGAQTNVKDSKGNLPLHRACSNANTSCFSVTLRISLLFCAGSHLQINDINHKGETAIELAQKKGIHRAVKLLLNNGAKTSFGLLEAAGLDMKTSKEDYDQILTRYEVEYDAARLVQRWLSAPYIEMNTDERLTLNADTAQFVKQLSQPKQGLRALGNDWTLRQIIKEGFSCSSAQKEALALWVAKHPNSEPCLTDLCKSIKTDRSIDSSSFEEIDKYYAKIIQNNSHSNETGDISTGVWDVDKIIFSLLDPRDLLALRSTSRGHKAIASYLFGQQHHRPAFEQPIDQSLSPAFPNLSAVKKFFGNQYYKVITHLSLKKLETSEKIDATSFPRLTHFAIGGPITQEQCTHLSSLNALESLSLHDTLGINDFTFLENFKKLQFLQLLRSLDWDMLWKDLKCLQGCQDLESLVLQQNKLNSPATQFFAPLENCKKLKELRIILRQSIDSLDFLKSFPQLEHFEYQQQHGVCDLKGLQFCLKLTKLRLSLPTAIAIANPHHIALCKHLKFLALSGNFDLSQLELEDLRDLDLSSNHLVQNLNFLEKSNNLSHLRIVDCPFQTLDFLDKLQNLESFVLHRSPSKNLSGLRKSRGLKILELRNWPINDLSFLQYLDNLTNLTLNKVGGVGGIGVSILSPYLRCWNSLEHLDLSNNVRPELDFLVYCANLKTLKLSGCTHVLRSLNHLTCCKKLENFELSNYFLERIPSLNFLQNCKNLKTLDLSGATIQDYSSLKELKELRILKLSKCQFVDSNCMQCSLDLSFLRSLKKLKVVMIEGLVLNKKQQNRLKADYPNITFYF